MSTRRHRATCCTCVCSWRVVGANRDLCPVRVRGPLWRSRWMRSRMLTPFYAPGVSAFGIRCARHSLWRDMPVGSIHSACSMANHGVLLDRIHCRRGRFLSSHERHLIRRPCQQALIRQAAQLPVPALVRLRARTHIEGGIGSSATSSLTKMPSGPFPWSVRNPVRNPVNARNRWLDGGSRAGTWTSHGAR